MDVSQWPQHQVGSLARTMEEIQAPPNNMINSNSMSTISTNSRASQMVERRTRPQKEQNLNCPRCNSTNTKFCYYNNYSLSQPRYFCKTCRRYWTQGGSLRNVPVGGGSRKNKRSSSSSSSSAPSMSNNASTPIMPTKRIPDLNPPHTLPHLITAPQNPSKFLEAQDLNLAFPMGHEAINVNGDISNSTPSATTTATANSCGGGTGNSTPVSALELLRGGIASRGSLNSYVPMPIPDPNSPLYPSGLPNLQEFKPNVGVFSSSHGDDHGNSSNIIGGARLLFPFADMNKLASSAEPAHHHPIQVDVQSKGDNDHHQQHHHQHHHHHHHHHHQGSSGYWTGMLGGGAW